MDHNLRKGFSLTELMVVIAILAVLAAVLFPVYGSVRRQAHRTTCLSNLRQMGVATGLYSNDANGHLPVGAILQNPNTGVTQKIRDVLKPLEVFAGGDAAFRCPEDNNRLVPRWVVSAGIPRSSRLMIPDGSNILAQCMHHLDTGWRGGPGWAEILPVKARKGKHLVLRADLGVDRFDSQTLRSLRPKTVSGTETWEPATNDLGLGYGVFASENWPPEWIPLPEDIMLNWGFQP